MKKILKSLISGILISETRSILKKYKPEIIGIAGSVGKTTTKDAVYAVLKSQINTTGKTFGSLNTEFSLPLNVLGQNLNLDIETFDFKSRVFKAYVILRCVTHGLVLLLARDKNFPTHLVLEMAEDKPGDMDRLLSIVQPKIGVITAIGDVPAHSGFYKNTNGVAEENSKLIASLPKDGAAFLNADEDIVLAMSGKVNCPMKSFGFNQGDFIASDMATKLHSRELEGLSFKIRNLQNEENFLLQNALGRPQIYAALAAAAVGSYYGISLEQSAAALRQIKFPKNRMQLQVGPKGSLLINDSYNSSPLAVKAALEAFNDIANTVIKENGKGKKIIVLGDMLELGDYSKDAHRDIGAAAAPIADILYCIGAFAEDIAFGARSFMPYEKMRKFATSSEAAPAFQAEVQPEDVILLKGSRGVWMQNVLK